jgi:serine/threonine-protein kinase
MVSSQEPTKEYVPKAAATPPSPSTQPFSAETVPPGETPGPQLPRLGRFELLHEIGQGGMGRVFRANDPLLDRPVALKTIRSGLLASSEEIERFLNEARAIAQFRHPHIVSLFDMGQEQGHYYLALEYVSGGTLTGQLAECTRSSPRRAVELMEKIARAVHYAHEARILHRDLKPGNILIDQAGEPRVTDFGLVKFLEGNFEVTRQGQAVGTLPYMSPEQAAGNVDIGPASDIWSLGVILFEMLMGRRPFQGATPTELHRHITESEPDRPRKLRRDLDADLETILLKCLEKNPADRYASAQALADDLRNWLDGKPIQARPLSRAGRVLRSVRRHPLAWLSACTLVLGLAAAMILWATHDPLREVHEMQEMLRAGKPVTLIGQTGPPRHSRILLGDSRSRTSVTPDQLFTVSTWETCLVELLPDPGIDRYRFEVEVLHSQASRNSPGGVVWGYHKQPTPKGWATIFSCLSFSDRFNTPKELKKAALKVKPPPGNRVQMNTYLVEEPGPGERYAFFSGKPTFYEPLQENEKRWRCLAVEVTPERVRTFWENKPMEGSDWKTEFIAQKSRQAIEMQIKLGVLPVAIEDVVPQVRPRQGLGVMVFQGAAKFRNAVLQPLLQE